MSHAPTVRLWIIESIRRIDAGEAFTWSDWEAQPLEGWDEIEPKRRFIMWSEENPAYAAWMALRWWVNDDDIRAKDPEYGEMRKRQLRDLLQQIKRQMAD